MKKIFLVFATVFLFSNLLFAQVPQDWMHKSPANGMWGMDTDGAYKFLVGKKSTTCIVAVIDSGVEVDHPDLQSNIWTNPNEIPDNGIDDDKNGYIDDIHGWDFIGGKNGDVKQDTYELTRLYKMYSDKFGSKDASSISASDKAQYADYQKIKKDFEAQKTEADKNFTFYEQIYNSMKAVLTAIGSDNPSKADLEVFTTEDQQLMTGKIILQSVVEKGTDVKNVMDQLKEAYDHFESQSKYGLNPDFNPRTIVGDNYTDATEKYYGNNEVEGPDAMHGSHVSGMIGAVRDNNIGMNGVTDNVKIMAIRAVPDGDERDKDIANAIRYAVDNGARVINMSFGKSFPYNKQVVDDAVKYAMSKDVLLVHGSGNDNKNVDVEKVYPNDQMIDGSIVTNWINVGATDIDGNAASFSNYGKKNVDVFAPGVDIYSTVTNNDYKYLDGTSMASPATAGVAALVRSYYPTLTAPQVKQILIQSCVKPSGKTLLPGSEKKKTKLSKISIGGGVVNALNAVKLADSIK
jgi:cell wall-associated protease